MFFFETIFNQVYNGITGSATLSTVVNIGQTILLFCTLYGVYEAWSRGGDPRALAVVGAKYLIMNLILSRYPDVFGTLNDGFNHIAHLISPNDVVSNWTQQVHDYFSPAADAATSPWRGRGFTAWYNLIPGGLTGIVSLLFQLVAVIIFPIVRALFGFFYSLYGAIIYVCGPLVLALYPAIGVGQLARTYMVNLLTWNAWGIIYAVMGQLLTIMNANSLDAIFAAHSFGGIFENASGALLVSLSTILLSLLIAFIPFLAKRVVSGDLGSSLFSALSIAGAAVQTAAVALSGFAAGLRGGGGKGPDPDPPGPPPFGGQQSSNKAPTPPSQKGSDGGGGSNSYPDPSGGSGADGSSGTAPKAPDDTRQTQTSGTSTTGDNGSNQSPKGADGTTTLTQGGQSNGSQSPSGNGNGGSPKPANTTPPKQTANNNRGVRAYAPHVSGLNYLTYGATLAAAKAAGFAYRKAFNRKSNKE